MCANDAKLSNAIMPHGAQQTTNAQTTWATKSDMYLHERNKQLKYPYVGTSDGKAVPEATPSLLQLGDATCANPLGTLLADVSWPGSTGRPTTTGAEIASKSDWCDPLTGMDVDWDFACPRRKKRNVAMAKMPVAPTPIERPRTMEILLSSGSTPFSTSPV